MPSSPLHRNVFATAFRQSKPRCVYALVRGSGCRSLHVTPSRRDEARNGPQGFKPQLYDSVAQRVVRERERQRKYIEERAEISEEKSRPFYLTFSRSAVPVRVLR